MPAYSLPGSVSLNDAISQGAGKDMQAVELGFDDLAFLQYTGGTTGVAKGAMLTHKNLVANMLQSKAWMKSAGVGEEPEVVVSALPLYHIFALTANCLVHMSLGGVNVLITNPRDMDGFIKELQKVDFTFLRQVLKFFCENEIKIVLVILNGQHLYS